MACLFSNTKFTLPVKQRLEGSITLLLQMSDYVSSVVYNQQELNIHAIWKLLCHSWHGNGCPPIENMQQL
jgi:hypothetical protein